MFLRGPLLVCLKDVVKEVMKEMKSSAVRVDLSDPTALWIEVNDLLARIESKGSKQNAEDMDKAATLLYLANGTTWNWFHGLLADEPSHNAQYVRVEPMLPLLRRCGWESKDETNADPKQLVKRLRAELKTCLG